MELHSRVKKQRVYSKLPVIIVEDHQEVLKHIYRAIATRHLPFENISMVHLDSHPDLQIPSKIPAKDVFNLTELSKHLSIENWIIPAVYAGHISHFVWVKPPWADQLPEGPRRVTVGRHVTYDTIRINWPDEYYLSDVMYADSEDMIDSKQLDVNVVTLKYKTKHDYIKYQTAEDVQLLENKDQESRKDTIKGDDLHTSAESKSLDSCQTFERKSADKLLTSDRLSGNCTENQKEEDCKECREGDLPGMNQNVLKVVEESVSTAGAFILDIDLDFFSTQNPFKLEYTLDQFNILKELYHFEAPKSSNKEELRQIQEKRAAQLSDLKNAITWCLKGDVESAHTDTDNLPKSWQKMLGLIKDLKASSAETLNGELLHMAGETTCDDEDDLPHHVSSEEEIGALMVQVQEVLSGIPKPIMVTIARSSLDDYCPKKQVGGIQELVIKMLNDLYTDVEVQKDYEDEIVSTSSETKT